VFVKEYSEQRKGFIVTVSPDAASAEVFLKENTINRPFHYIHYVIVETPESNW